MENNSDNNKAVETPKEEKNKIRKQRKPSIAETYIAILFMLCALVILYAVVGWDLKITLLLVLVFNVFMAWRCGVPFKSMEKAIGDRIGSLGFFMLVLLGIGFLIGTFLCSGTIPVLVAWLVQLIDPKIVLLLCLLLPSVLAIAVCSSFATLGTIGIIMFSVAVMDGIPPGLAAAACICGANFGQYISPLADTPNLCAQVNDLSIQRYTKGFSLPFGIAYILTAIFFLVIGGKYVDVTVDNSVTIQAIVGWVSANFNMSILVLLPFVVAIILAIRKVHAVVMIYGTGVTALILGFTLQHFGFINCINAAYNGFSTGTMLAGVEIPEVLSGLLNRGGISSMADGIVFFIIMLSCIALFDVMGVFDVLKESMFKKSGSAGILTLKASICSFIFAIVACEPYTTIMLSSEVIKRPIKDAGYETTKSANISMAMGQLTAYLCPWSFLAVYMGIICGVPVLDFAKYAVLFWLVPVVIIVLSFLGIQNTKLSADYKEKDSSAA